MFFHVWDAGAHVLHHRIGKERRASWHEAGRCAEHEYGNADTPAAGDDALTIEALHDVGADAFVRRSGTKRGWLTIDLVVEEGFDPWAPDVGGKVRLGAPELLVGFA